MRIYNKIVAFDIAPVPVVKPVYEDPDLFSGLKIMEAGEKYTSMMGKYPVIFLTLKSAKTGDEKSAFKALRYVLAREFDRHRWYIVF